MWKAFLCFVAIIGFVAWVVYAWNNSYHIVLGGLKPCYHIWLTHLFFLLLEYIYQVLRPVWTLQPADLIYDSNIVCSIHGKVTAFFIVVPSFLGTLFSLSKAQIYFRVRYPDWYRSFTIVVYTGVLPILGYLASVETGPTYKDDKKICMSQGTIDRLFLMLYLLHWLVMNIFMIIIFWLHVDLVNESFPSLDHQMKLNRRWIPLVFLTSFVFMAFTIIAETRTSSDTMVYIGFMAHVLDQNFNSILMFHTIFGHVKFLEEAEKVRHGLELILSNKDADNDVIELGLENEDYTLAVYWLDLPGVNPIQMTHELVNELDLWDAVIDNERFLKQLNKIKDNHGGMISHICRSPYEVIRCFGQNNNDDILHE